MKTLLAILALLGVCYACRAPQTRADWQHLQLQLDVLSDTLDGVSRARGGDPDFAAARDAVGTVAERIRTTLEAGVPPEPAQVGIEVALQAVELLIDGQALNEDQKTALVLAVGAVRYASLYAPWNDPVAPF